MLPGAVPDSPQDFLSTAGGCVPRLDLAWLDMAANRYEHYLSAQRALDAVQRCVWDCPSPTAAVMANLVEAARAAVAALDPTREVLATVRNWLRGR
jgi:hypothetical protein